MVVSEEVNPNNTTTEHTQEETSSPLTLDYTTPTPQEDRMEILSQTEIIEETQPKEIILYEEKGIESGIEIHYTSMKLKHFPIKESNLLANEQEVEQIGLNSSTVYVGDTPLLNTALRVISFNKFKLLELKTREFKLGLSIKLEGDTIVKDGDFFRYEIFSKLKNSRLHSVAEIFKRIFSGERVSFTIKDLYGSIIFENPIQSHKFGMIMETVKNYEKIESLLGVSKSKPLSDSKMDFYTLHLLSNLLDGKTTLNSWLNYRITNNNSIASGDSLVFVKDHYLDFRGINYNLREKLIVKDVIREKEVDFNNNIVVGYRKLVEIQLEKLEIKE